MGRRRLTGPNGVQLPLLPLVYGLDIETDTTVTGLDPTRSSVVAVAVSGPDGETTFSGDEVAVLRALDRWLRAAPPGFLATWNGAGVDLPFLADRAAACEVRLGLQLVADPGLDIRHAPLTGHAAPYRASWYRHLHLDACCLHRTVLAGQRESFSLKPLARDLGLLPVEADAA